MIRGIESDTHYADRGRVLILVENLSVPRDRRVWQEAIALRRAGWDVVVISPQGSDRDTAPHEWIDGVEIHRFPLEQAGGGAVAYLLEYVRALWRIGRLVRVVSRTATFDVVHACSPPDLLLVAALPLRRRGTRFVFDHHDLSPELYLSRFGGRRDPVYWALRGLERLTFMLADVVLATNESYRRVALTRGNKRTDDVFVVRNGPDLDQFAPTHADETLKRGREHLIAYVGIMGPQDGVDHALRALARLKASRSDWLAVFAGDGDELPRLRGLAGELGLDGDVDFVGLLEPAEVVRLLAAADVCLAPEPSNPLNDVSTMVKVAEYMAMERPVVAFDLPETRFTADGAALFAASGDHAWLARLVSELLDDPSLRDRLGRAGRRRVEDVLAWEHAERVLLAAYDRAVSPGRTVRGRPSIARGVS